MKTIDIDDDVYAYIASQTQAIGESASDILRRLLEVDAILNANDLGSDVERLSVPAAVRLDINLLELVTQRLASDTISSVVERFLLILSLLARKHGHEFANVLTVKGRNRLYFATEKSQLLASGSSTNPKQVPDSDYWVVTNNNTSKKANMLNEVLEVLGYQPTEREELIQLLITSQ